MDLGIIEELELDCTPRPGELVVNWVDANSRTLGAAAFGASPGVVGAWEQFSLRYCGPWAPRTGVWFSRGDIVVRLPT